MNFGLTKLLFAANYFILNTHNFQFPIWQAQIILFRFLSPGGSTSTRHSATKTPSKAGYFHLRCLSPAPVCLRKQRVSFCVRTACLKSARCTMIRLPLQELGIAGLKNYPFIIWPCVHQQTFHPAMIRYCCERKLPGRIQYRRSLTGFFINWHSGRIFRISFTSIIFFI